MKKRVPLLVSLGILGYLLLLLLLVAAEKGNPRAGIQSFGDALWYSLVTMTTVGYGDLYPVSTPGRLIGLLFLLLSIGALVSFLSTGYAFLRMRVLPRIRLEQLRGRKVYFFSEINELSVTLARDLALQEREARFVFCRTDEGSAASVSGLKAQCFPGDVTDILRNAEGTGKKTVFCIGENIAENNATVRGIGSGTADLYCLAPEAGDLPEVHFFDPFICTARDYWLKYPIREGETSILLAGGGKLAQEMLNQATLMNCCVPFRTVTYHLFGDWESYRLDHPRLLSCFSGEEGDRSMDALIFHQEAWNAKPDLLEEAGRIIFCGDSSEENAECTARLLKFFPVTGLVYAAAQAVVPPAVAFGRTEEIATKEMILQSSLDCRAQMLHDLYCRIAGVGEPWEKLSPFLKASNRSSADHMLTKVRLLMPEWDGRELSPHVLREAAKRWEAAPDKEPYRQNEHERWYRFHALYNWRQGPDRNPVSRTHPCLVPYDELPPEEQEKDENAWLQIGLIGKEGGECP